MIYQRSAASGPTVEQAIMQQGGLPRWHRAADAADSQLVDRHVSAGHHAWCAEFRERERGPDIALLTPMHAQACSAWPPRPPRLRQPGEHFAGLMRLLFAEETSVIEVPSSPLLSLCSLQQQTAGKPWTSRFSQVGDARSICFLRS